MGEPDIERLEQELQQLLRRVPITHVSQLEMLDGDEIQEGYRDGRGNFPCGPNRSRSYWHGWRNGMIDGHHMESDWASRSLAASYVADPTKEQWDANSPDRVQK